MPELTARRTGYQDVREAYRSRDGIPDLRTAAYALAISKIARYYVEIGL